MAPTISSVIVARLAGLPLSLVGQLVDGHAASEAAEVNRLEDQLNNNRLSISAQLYEAVPALEDKGLRGRLITLRRDLFNGRIPAAADLSEMMACLPQVLGRALSKHMALVRAHEDRCAAGAEVFTSEVRRCRLRFQQLVLHEGFQKGLQLASSALARNLQRYSTMSLDGPLGSRAEHIERGLLLYWTRMACKATPFASFCTVIRARLIPEPSPSGKGIARIQGSLGRTRSEVRLSKDLRRILYQHLLTRPAFRRILRLSLNPTTAITEEAAHFLCGDATREHCRRIAVNPALRRVLEALRASNATVVDVAAALAADPGIASTQAEAEEFLGGLVGIGLLRLNSGVADQDPEWDLPINALAEASGDEDALVVAALLRTLREYANTLPLTSAAMRAPLMAKARDAFHCACNQLGITAVSPDEILVYEDVTADAEMVVAETPDVRHALEKLKELLRLVLPLGSPRDAMASMRHFFEAKYDGTNGRADSVPLLRFYEDYYRDHYQAHSEYEAGRTPSPPGYQTANPFGLPIVEERRRVRAALVDLLTRRLNQTGPAEVNISYADIAQIVEPLESIREAGLSFTAFVQVVAEEGVAARVLFSQSMFLPGFGKMFSRFLYLMDPEVLADTREANRRLSTNAQLAELHSVGDFNANLHPPLVDVGILYPSAEVHETSQALEVTDLEVTSAPDDAHGLALRDVATGTRVIPVDLGFLNPRQRPPLFRLLRNFIPVREIVVLNSMPLHPTGSGEGSTPGIHVWPRLTYEGAVVLRRRCWTIPESQFPTRGAREEAWTHFRRVSRWRKQIHLPRTVYIRFYPRQVSPPHVHVEAKREVDSPAVKPDTVMRDWSKPQYMDFDSPLLVGLLDRLTKGLKEYWAICEEQLPCERDLPASEDGPYVSELVLQLDFDGGEAS